MDQENQTDDFSRKVIASAIDNDCLILEEQGTGQKIQWPLDKIPQPFQLGHTLNLTLESTVTDSEFSSKKSVSTSDEEQMRKDLENLVN